MNHRKRAFVSLMLILLILLSTLSGPALAGVEIRNTEYKVSSSTLTGTLNSWLLITEVASYPSTEKDIGQLIEVYNNTQEELDLYDYEIVITISRDSNLEVSLGEEKFKGGFYLANEPGQRVLKSGEIAVLWVVFDQTQQGYTEADVREVAAAGQGAAAIPAGTQIFRIDTTDKTTTAFGEEPYVLRSGVCYAMVNKRIGHTTKLAPNCGAFARIYGQMGQGRSQFYGDTPHDDGKTNPRWQADLTDTTGKLDYNLPMNFGTLTASQLAFIQVYYIPEDPAVKAAGVEALESLIDAIGEVNQDNSEEVLPKIEAAENARDALEEKYGEEALGEVGNLAKLTEAREKYDALHPVFKRGDVDGDGEINARDALLALQHSVQIKILEQEQFTAADVNRDSKVDAADALCMLQYSVGIIDSFPGQSDEDGLTDDDPIVDTDDPENPGNPEEPNVPENSAGPDASVSGLGGISAYTLSGLPIGKSVQQFAFAETNEEAYIFVTQREEATTYLSRCKVGEDGKSAACIDYAVLEGYGHGESLDVSMHNGQTYLFIGSDANANADKYDWSTTITRLLYEAGNIGDIKKITGVEYATADGSPIKQGETPYRVNFAVDDAADRIVVYFRSQSGTHALSAYRLSTLQEMLDAADEISLKDCAEAFLATTGVKKLADICPNGSFQGLETTPDGEILITGGTTSVQPQLTRFTVQEGAIVLESVTDLRWLYSSRVGTVDWSIGCDYYEIESIRCYEGRMYVSFTPGSANTIQNYTEIFALVDPSVQEGA